MNLDAELPKDVESVLKASALLDITEYELFQLAYARWHGGMADRATLEPFFVHYMFDLVVPLWVRHFARLVEELWRRGRLDREALGVARLPNTTEMVRNGVRYSVIIGIVLVSIIVFAEFTAQFMKLGDRCLFPPCY